MNNSECFRDLIKSNFPNYNVSTEEIDNHIMGAIRIIEGVKVVVYKGEQTENPLFDSFQIIKGSVRDKEYNWTKEEAANLLMSSITQVIDEHEEKFNQD